MSIILPMVQTKTKTTSAARERIVETATELFYRNGYQSTGINEVIEKSGVAKATFYSHFPSKDMLFEVCLKLISEREIAFINDAIRNSGNDALKRFMSVIRTLEPWANQTNLRGCAFMNVASEIPNPHNPLRKVGVRLYDQIRIKVADLTKELIASDRQRYGHLSVNEVTIRYMLFFAGAVSFSELYHEVSHIQDAVKAVGDLVEVKAG